ncbi:MAG TPA: Ig-like domain-containing protein, partial [Polyangia bacterium]|nr:Ig-like domain-containing protein [Polyangia bacterium]
ALPSDTNGVYFVLTAPGISQSDSDGAFCTDYCGWHTANTPSNIKYSFVGSGDHCPQNCGLSVQGPNQNQGADEMASVIAHELAETVTDPEIDAWINPGWIENGDLCAWNFGRTFTASEDGSQANVHLGSRDFLIQQLWVNAGAGGCAMNYTYQPISIGGSHTLAVQTDGSLWSWGKNDKAQLGDGNTTDRFTPRMLSAGSGPTGPRWTSVAAGNKFSLALRSDGTLWAWGDRSLGQLGDGVVSSTPVFAAKQIGGAEWAVVRAGDQHVAAIKKDGTLWSWGYNGYGQLGNGDPGNANQAVPVQEAYGINQWISISAGAVHTMGLTAYGNLWSWGWNDWGTLGVGDTVSRNTPAAVTVPSSIAGWNMFDGGFDFALGMGSNGSILSWGRNFYGQLDAPSWQAFSLDPTQWVAPTNWSVVSAGYLHGMAVRQDGTLWTWGSNNSGQLGTGAAFGSTFGPLAQESTRASNWVAALGRQQTSVGVKADGTVLAWGDNASGQLGTGDTVSHNTPTASLWTSSRPIVQLTAPSPLTTTSFSAPATIAIAASATGGRITKVEFWRGSTKLGEDTTSPYSFTWSNVGVGVYSIVAKAFNALGESTSSDPVQVTVATLSGTTATPAASVNFTTEGTIDWLDAGLVNAASIDKKNVTTHAISNFGIYAEGDIGFAQDTVSAVAVNWTDGSPHLKPHTNGTPTTNGVKISMPFQSYGYQMNVTGSASATRVLSIYAKLVNADATLTFRLDGLTYTNSWSNTSATPAYRVYRISYRPSSTSSMGTVAESITALRTGGNVSFLGATLH